MSGLFPSSPINSGLNIEVSPSISAREEFSYVRRDGGRVPSIACKCKILPTLQRLHVIHIPYSRNDLAKLQFPCRNGIG